MSTAARGKAILTRLAFAVAVCGVRACVRLQGLVWRPAASGDAPHSRFAVVSHAVPPMWSGQAMVLERLLGRLPQEQVVVIATSRGVSVEPGRNTTIPLPKEPCEALWSMAGWWASLSVFVRCCIRGWRIAEILSRERCVGVVACTGDLIDMPASMVASRAVGIPLVAYYFDDYVAQWSWAAPAFARARLFEPLILGGVRSVLVPNERLAAAVAQRSATQPMIIRNPSWTEQVPDSPRPLPADGARCRIVYTGAVYHVNYAAFRCLIASFAELADLRPELHIYTAQDPTQLAAEGIAGPNVCVFPHVDPGQAWERQQEATVLFLGFAFDEAIAAIVQSSAPGKLGDYLASGVPIVALAPRESFLIEYLSTQNCGAVVDQLDPQLLAAAIRALVTDVDHRETLVTNALGCARREFAASAAVQQLVRALGPRGEAAEHNDKGSGA